MALFQFCYLFFRLSYIVHVLFLSQVPYKSLIIIITRLHDTCPIPYKMSVFLGYEIVLESEFKLVCEESIFALFSVSLAQ